jgi:cytoplasmic iron level regulating protein YaaA (DUF328/UPF0246 family)
MLLVISPAKTLDFETPAVTQQYSRADFLDRSEQLIQELRDLSPSDISALMKISDKLGTLNYGRFQDWQAPTSKEMGKQAILAFKGDVYTGLDADNLSEDDLAFAQQHLRILSGLYGLLRPLDIMQPYRLEMGTPFANSGGKNLYQFWGDTLTAALNQCAADNGDQVLVNLASNEYFKAVTPKKLDMPVITPVFKDWKGDKYKIISFYAKKARGMMAAYIIKNRLTEVEAIKSFDVEGYRYSEAMSDGNEWVFIRDSQG